MPSKGHPHKPDERRSLAALASHLVPSALAGALALALALVVSPAPALADETDDEPAIGFTAQDSGLPPDTT